MTLAISTSGLTKKYGMTTVLQPLDLSVMQGDVFGYLGPNGAGKTTTIRLLLGLIRPSAGNAKLFDTDVQTETVKSHAHVAYVPGEAALWPNMSGSETLTLLGNIHGSYDVAYREKLTKRFEFDDTKRVRTYSKGNRQKLLLIAALMTRAKLLILDEPTSGLDPLMEQVFRECVLEAKDNGQTVFLSSHILSEVEALCDKIAILRKGKIVEQGTLDELRHLSSLSVEVLFAGEAPRITNIEGVSHITSRANSLKLQVHGTMNPLLTALKPYNVTKIISREPSLEELFLAQYGDKEAVTNE